jgi:predicted nuclease of predicted toxin-antitoxin system
MRFLADENLPAALVNWLRKQGHDVLWASEQAPGETDANWLSAAETQGRIVLTADKDFGELVFRDHRNSHGVILIRLESLNIAERLTRLQETWGVIEANQSGRFIVISKNRVRARPLI